MKCIIEGTATELADFWRKYDSSIEEALIARIKDRFEAQAQGVRESQSKIEYHASGAPKVPLKGEKPEVSGPFKVISDEVRNADGSLVLEPSPCPALRDGYQEYFLKLPKGFNEPHIVVRIPSPNLEGLEAVNAAGSASPSSESILTAGDQTTATPEGSNVPTES
jgi:hypothetical protein